MLILAGMAQDDTDEDAAWLASKPVRMRIFPDADGKMNLSVADMSVSLVNDGPVTIVKDSRKRSQLPHGNV